MLNWPGPSAAVLNLAWAFGRGAAAGRRFGSGGQVDPVRPELGVHQVAVLEPPAQKAQQGVPLGRRGARVQREDRHLGRERRRDADGRGQGIAGRHDDTRPCAPVQRSAQCAGRVRDPAGELPPGQDLLGQVSAETDEGRPVRLSTGDVGDPAAHGQDHRYRRISASRRTLAALMNSIHVQRPAELRLDGGDDAQDGQRVAAQFQEVVVHADGPYVHLRRPDRRQPAFHVIARILEQDAPALGHGRGEIPGVHHAVRHRHVLHDQHAGQSAVLAQLPPHVVAQDRPAHVPAQLGGRDGHVPPVAAHDRGLGPADTGMCGQYLGYLRQGHHGCSPVSRSVTSSCTWGARSRSAWPMSSTMVRAPSTGGS